MSDATFAAILFFLYAINSQWAFRFQRAGRGLLLLAFDSATAHRQLFSSLMPTSYVASIWVGRLLWISCAVFAWRAWHWYSLLGLIFYGFLLGSWVDRVSPWPSYARLLNLIQKRIASGGAGLEAMALLSTIGHIQEKLEAGMHFEAVTTGAWISRATDAAQRATDSKG